MTLSHNRTASPLDTFQVDRRRSRAAAAKADDKLLPTPPPVTAERDRVRETKSSAATAECSVKRAEGRETRGRERASEMVMRQHLEDESDVGLLHPKRCGIMN